MSKAGRRPPAIGIIGGGFTGAAIAWNLARESGVAARIIVVEPRERLGGGLAYSSRDPAFRINVPAAKMSLDPDDIEDFARWVETVGAVDDDAAARLDDGRVFPQRSEFGRYVAERLLPFLANGVVEHRRASALGAKRTEGGFRVELDDGTALDVDRLVLAVSHPPPQPPERLRFAFSGHPKFVADTTTPGALAVVHPDDRVLVVGTGLTGADVIASLDRRGHRGPITAIARRGLRSKGHAPFAQEQTGDFTTKPATTTLQLLKCIRAEVAAVEARGLTWHAVLDAVRTQGPAIWAALPLAERRRLVRHLRAYWDVHRFRVAPQVEAALDRRIAAGGLDLFAASIAGAELQDDVFEVALRRRRLSEVVSHHFDSVLVATGPAHGAILETAPLLIDLARQGLVKADPVGLGIATDEQGHAIGADGTPVDTLFIGGPLARGTFGELMGLPEVAAYAKRVAEALGR
ncbi:FAD/NAD(P)-binding protein [Kaistia algarum]|uniref:FAD/NAD(P)-binding protein n=1 Tax=Kaistia algarum TaxID=2083279 RepID=UPI00224E814E|nr:FAD/NAD(P)-binding protein [Kaistia algarum]MCX5516322.1 FAD/NAD(P)-binding protein [Kaistia algarum]